MPNIKKKKNVKDILERIELKAAVVAEGIVDEAQRMLDRFSGSEGGEPQSKTLAELMGMLEKARKIAKGEEGESGVVRLESFVPRPDAGEDEDGA